MRIRIKTSCDNPSPQKVAISHRVGSQKRREPRFQQAFTLPEKDRQAVKDSPALQGYFIAAARVALLAHAGMLVASGLSLRMSAVAVGLPLTTLMAWRDRLLERDLEGFIPPDMRAPTVFTQPPGPEWPADLIIEF